MATWYRKSRIGNAAFSVCALASAVGCHQDMYNQPRYEPLEESDFFDDGRASRPLVPGTVYRGQLPADSVLLTGSRDGELIDELPVELDKSLLLRGEERFNIYCSVCHDRTGEGNGMIVERGYRRPPTLHSDRLRGVPLGHFFDVTTNGFGAMPAYSPQISVDDRWAIVAYIRALQLSQFAKANDLPVDLRDKLR